jgi:hypothetical protein
VQVRFQEQRQSGFTRIRTKTNFKTTAVTKRDVRYVWRGIRVVLQSQANGREQADLLLIAQVSLCVCEFVHQFLEVVRCAVWRSVLIIILV